MNIQINVSSTIDRQELIDALNVVSHSVDSWIKEYEKNRWNFDHDPQRNGTLFTKVNIQTKCNGKTMNIKINSLEK